MQRTSTRLPRRRLLATGLAALLLAACSWAVPADPGLNTRLRSTQAGGGTQADAPPPAQAAVADPQAQRLYQSHCGRCHEPYAPQLIAAADWPRYVRRYGPQAGLYGADRARVLRWLQANAP